MLLFQNIYKHSKSILSGDYMLGLGSQELILILVIALLLFGANKLPELARSLGLSVREFKKAMKEVEDTED
jgi:sec-independent protein translocase protein TatA